MHPKGGGTKNSKELDSVHPSGDMVLSAICKIDGPVGDLVREYPGRKIAAQTSDWLDRWFSEHTKSNFEGGSTEDIPEEIPTSLVLSAIPEQVVPANTPTKLLSIQPHFFRGFRKLPEPVDLSSSLVVLDGRNSSGKTSLAEALEWLFTGELLRRSLKSFGNPRELESCVSNQFRPGGEETWVEATFYIGGESKHLTLRRVLDRDYGPTAVSECESRIFKDGCELTKTEEAKLVDELFAGHPPLLMQHSLGMFVNSSPSERRDYFERLLRLDELTHLIEKAVVGPSRLVEFTSPSNSVALKKWERLKEMLSEPDSKQLRNAEGKKQDELDGTIQSALLTTAREKFGDISLNAEFADVRATLKNRQSTVRQESFPLLEKLRPRKVVDRSIVSLLSRETIENKLSQVRDSLEILATAKSSAKAIEDSQMAIFRAFKQLEEVGLIKDSEDGQICPVCEYPEVHSLTQERIQEIRSWKPAQDAVQSAYKHRETAVKKLKDSVKTIKDARRDLLPMPPDQKQWDEALQKAPEAVSNAAECVRTTLETKTSVLIKLDRAVNNLDTMLPDEPTTDESLNKVETESNEIIESLDLLLSAARDYASDIETLENAVGSYAKKDSNYRLRELWIDVADDLSSLVDDLAWEKAKKKAQKLLVEVREKLKLFRQKLLEHQRDNFNVGIDEIWSILRDDRYSAFKQLYIPKPRGKGFPVEIEIKAILDDKQQKLEVDVLRVFSESQVNVLGIAAFVTRSKLLGHRILIFDDPVQSMDEDHFKTFASDLLNHLLEEDLQIIILTHNDTFARDISHAHYDLEDYTTINIKQTRQRGCQIEEGNRRVRERLKRANKKAEDGNLKDAWKLLRLVLERLYLVIYKKHGPPNFKPSSWADQTAEYMWNEGVGEIVVESQTSISGSRLKEILDMAAAGAHDKHPRGLTDFNRAKDDLENLAKSLNIVD